LERVVREREIARERETARERQLEDVTSPKFSGRREGGSWGVVVT